MMRLLIIVAAHGIEDGLVGYLNFNEGDGSILSDLSSNGSDGTIFGASGISMGHPLILLI